AVATECTLGGKLLALLLPRGEGKQLLFVLRTELRGRFAQSLGSLGLFLGARAKPTNARPISQRPLAPHAHRGPKDTEVRSIIGWLGPGHQFPANYGCLLGRRNS